METIGHRRGNVFGMALLVALGALIVFIVVAVRSCGSQTVDSAADLINAIEDANASDEPVTISLVENGEYVLTEVNNTLGPMGNANGLPSITGDITIEGNGATIRRSDETGTPSFRIFHIASGGELKLDNLTISDGSEGRGGGIANDRNGTLELTNSVISGNEASFGGGISNYGGTVTLTDSTVSGNEADSGGGIDNSGDLELTNSMVSDNASARFGGGIYNYHAEMLELTNSTVNDNASDSSGGGIYNNAGMLELTNSTVNDNEADRSGGGIYNTAAGELELTNSIVIDNAADDEGGGIFHDDGALTLTGSIVARNQGGDIEGSVDSESDSLIGDGP